MHLESSGNFENGAPGRLSARVCPLAHRESLGPDINIQGAMVLAGKTWPSNFSQFASRVWAGKLHVKIGSIGQMVSSNVDHVRGLFSFRKFHSKFMILVLYNSVRY